LDQQDNNVFWHSHTINKLDRQGRHGHKSAIIWFTGLSGSGKSTIANKLEIELFRQGLSTYLLDGDNIRLGLNRDLGFSESDRKENIRRIGEVAKLMVDAGILVLAAFISPYQEDRQKIRSTVDAGELIEVYVRCPIDVCEQRDPKKLYEKVKKGQIQNFTGITAPYEEPVNPEVIIDSDKETPDKAVQKILQFLKEKNYF
jgi:adenylylsulfate kinase